MTNRKVIWKFPLELTEIQEFPMPKDAQVLTLQMQNGIPCLWFMVGQDASETQTRTFEIHGTGNPFVLEEKGVERGYIGTFQQPPYVWHVFERYEISEETIALDTGKEQN